MTPPRTYLSGLTDIVWAATWGDTPAASRGAKRGPYLTTKGTQAATSANVEPKSTGAACTLPLRFCAPGLPPSKIPNSQRGRASDALCNLSCAPKIFEATSRCNLPGARPHDVGPVVTGVDPTGNLSEAQPFREGQVPNGTRRLTESLFEGQRCRCTPISDRYTAHHLRLVSLPQLPSARGHMRGAEGPAWTRLLQADRRPPGSALRRLPMLSYRASG